MIQEGLGIQQQLALPVWQGRANEDPTTVILDKMREDIGLHGMYTKKTA